MEHRAVRIKEQVDYSFLMEFNEERTERWVDLRKLIYGNAALARYRGKPHLLKECGLDRMGSLNLGKVVVSGPTLYHMGGQELPVQPMTFVARREHDEVSTA